MGSHLHVRLDDPDVFKFWNFPGGEVGCTLVKDLGPVTSWSITARINTPEQLMQLLSAVDVIKRHHAEHRTGPAILRTLRIAYFPYARQDRRERDTSFILPYVVEMIDNLGFHLIEIVDPHSPVLPALFKKTTVKIISLATVLSICLGTAFFKKPKSCILAPDAGAAKRAGEVAALADLPLLQCSKTRNPVDGKLTNLTVPDVSDFDSIIVVDDICDGGGTFIKLASALGISRERLTLIVTHGIFSGQAMQNLQATYHMLVTTDSWQPRTAIEAKARLVGSDMSLRVIDLNPIP